MAIYLKAVKCPKCGEIIYSRAHHDFHYCSCKTCFVDGGFDYFRYSGPADSELYVVTLRTTKKRLYDDWNLSKDKYGCIPAGKKFVGRKLDPKIDFKN